MDRKQFIEWLIVKYMSNAEVRQVAIATKDMDATIPDDLDFDFLRVSILTNYDKRSMPDYNYMKQYFRKKTNKNYDSKWTPTTWNIYGKSKSGMVYEFANYMGVSEFKGREIFEKAHPELEYVGNNRAEMLERLKG